LGQHTAEVLRNDLGYSEDAIAALRRDGVIDRMTARVQS
jgi:crotonobetainyl-CoA:carnitine CoA-transferase CaiB-like acyl-CoA transferase